MTHFKSLALSVLAVFLTVFATNAPAQDPIPGVPPPRPAIVRPNTPRSLVPSTPADSADTAASDDTAAANPAPPSDSGEKMLSLKFSDSPLEMVLDRYAELTGRTILMAPGVKLNITLRIEKKVTVPQAINAIEAILAMNNVALVNEGDMFVKVVQINTARVEGDVIRTGTETEAALAKDAGYLVTEIIPLKHIELADAQAAIATVVHPYANVVALPRINSLFVTDTSVNIDRVKQLLSLIDQPIEMKEELHIIRVLHAKASDIKGRLAEIIAETEAQQKTAPAVVRPSLTGPPGVIRAAGVNVNRSPIIAAPESETKRDLIQGQVKLVADDRANILIIITRPENMEFFNKIVTAIDIGVERDEIVKVFRLEYADATEVEGMLSKLIGATTKDAVTPPGAAPAKDATGAAPERSAELSDYIKQMQARAAAAQAAPVKTSAGELNASSVKILSDKRSNALIIKASKGDMEAIEEIIKSMDIMLSQVLIEAIILGVTLDKNSETGVDWLQRSMTAYEQESTGVRKPLFAFTGGTDLGAGTPINALNTPSSVPKNLGYFLTFFDLNLDVVVKLSASDNRTRIISSPVILTTDNKKASIDVSEDLYFYKGQKPVNDGTGVTYVDDIERLPVGTTLSVTPRINKNKFVVMEIEQNTEDADKSKTIGTVDWPIIARRKMSASIAVTSGDTIMLGGMTKKTEVSNVTKIPFLADIPILGIPFRDTTRGNKREDVLVFITPYVLDTPEDIRNDALRRRDSTEVGGLWKRGWSNSKLADPSEQDIRQKKIQEKLERLKQEQSRKSVPALPPAPGPTNAPALPAAEIPAK
jgi:general secretion pathway protein D